MDGKIVKLKTCLGWRQDRCPPGQLDREARFDYGFFWICMIDWSSNVHIDEHM